MTAPGGDAIFRLRWEQENARVPEQARAQLVGLSAAQRTLNQTSSAGAAVMGNFARTTGQGTVAFQGFGEQAKKVATQSEEAGRGLSHVQRAMSVLAFEATGTSGPVGHLANALLLFGTGGMVTLTVAAGLAVIAAGYQLVTKDAREATESHQKFLDKLHETVAARVPEQDKLNEAKNELSNARDRLAELEHHADLVREGRLVGRGRTDRIALDEARAAVTTAEKVVAQLTPAAAKEHKKAGEDAANEFLEGYKTRFATADVPALAALISELQARIAAGGAKAAEKFGPLLQQAVELQFAANRPDTRPDAGSHLALFRPTPFQAPAFGTGPGAAVAANTARVAAQATAEQGYYNKQLELTRAILTRAQSPQQVFNLGLVALQTSLDQGEITVAQFDEGVKQLTEDMKKAKKGSELLAASIVTAVSGAIAAVISGGSAGGILAGIGGIVSLIPGGQLAGAVISGIGTIALAGESKGVTIDRYSQAALEQLKGIPSGPQRIELLVQSPTTGEIVDRVIYTLGERGRTDGVRRVPVFLVGR